MIVFGQYSWSADLEYYNTSAILWVMKEAEYNALSPQVTSGVTINWILDNSRLSPIITILCFHVSILVQFLHTFSRVPSVSYYIVKSESKTLLNVRFWLTSKYDGSSRAILCCLVKMLPINHPLRISK